MQQWFRNFAEEMIGPRVEAIVADGLCFVGTYAGNFHALNGDDGHDGWTYKADGPIGHSPCYDDGRVYFCTDGGFDRGSIVCLMPGMARSLEISGRRHLELTRLRWPEGLRRRSRGRVSRRRCKDRPESMDLCDRLHDPQAASFSGEAEDHRRLRGHAYLLFSTDGHQLWKSPMLAGLSLRDAVPTIWDDKVIVRTNPATVVPRTLHEGSGLVTAIQRRFRSSAEDKVSGHRQQYFVRRTDRREKAEYEGVLKILEGTRKAARGLRFDLTTAASRGSRR